MPELPEGVDEFQASSPHKNDRGYEAAANAAGALGAVLDGASKLGQAYTVAGSLIGFEPGGLAGIGGLVAGTFDVARGASAAKQAAVNRDMNGSIAGSLQVIQGASTYFAVLAPVFGALFGNPAVGTIVGKVASGVALASFAGRQGVGLYARAQSLASKAEKGDEVEGGSGAPPPGTGSAPSAPGVPGVSADALSLAGPSIMKASQRVPPATVEGAEDKSRRFEQTFAMVGSVDQFFRGIGGLASFWSVVDGLFSGSASGGLFGIPGLGYIGSAYSIATGVAMTKHSAVNRNTDGTVDGVLQTIGGLGALGCCVLGPAGMARIPAIIATAAGVGRIAYQIYAQSKRFKGDEEDESTPKKSLGQIAFNATVDVLNPFNKETAPMRKAEF